MTENALTGLAAVPVDHIKPSPNNPREHLTGIDELAVSIRENGLIQPLVVQRIPGHTNLQIVAGHRRHAAVKALGWTKVPCIIRRDMLPDEELLAMLVENGQRAGLDPIEEARALGKLKAAGISDAEIGRRIGRSGSHVNKRLSLLTLPFEEQEEIRAGAFSARDAETLVRQRRAEERKKIPNAGQIGRPPGRKTTPHFGDTHPLARAVRGHCAHGRGKPKVGGVGCGECWEAVIRADERAAGAAPDLQAVGS